MGSCEYNLMRNSGFHADTEYDVSSLALSCKS